MKHPVLKAKIALLVCALSLTLCAVALAAGGSCGENLTWNLGDGGVLRVSGSGPMANGTFWQDQVSPEEIKSLVVEEGVTSLGDNAFLNCTALTSVSLPQSLTSLGASVFEGCIAMKDFTLPDHIREMDFMCFFDAERLYVSSYLTDTAKTLGTIGEPFCLRGDSNWYIYDYSESNVYLGLHLAGIKPGAIHATMPDWVEGISQDCFNDHKELKSIYIPPTVKKLSVSDFAGVYRHFYIRCEPGSPAESFALANGIQYDNGEKQVIHYKMTNPSEKIDWIVKNYIRPGMSEKEKARVLHNWIINNAHYDEDIVVHSGKYILTLGYGVCSAYTEVYQQLLTKAGIANATLSGDGIPAEPNGNGHIWNLVRINGKWYHVDVTWDDPTTGPKDAPAISGKERFSYFLISDAQIAKDHTWAREISADKGRIRSYYDPAKGKEVFLQPWDNSCVYQLNWKDKTATVVCAPFDFTKKVEIPATYDFEGTIFKVTSIDANAFAGSNIQSVVIGKNIKRIGANAFKDCKKLRYITVKSTSLTADRIGDGAFSGLKESVTIRLPKKQFKTLKKILIKKGAPKKATWEKK